MCKKKLPKGNILYNVEQINSANLILSVLCSELIYLTNVFKFTYNDIPNYFFIQR